MLAAIAAARRWVHFENYIIRGDATGRRFADALVERARSGVRVRVLYDALGSFGTSRRYWRRLTQAGVEVRAFHPLLTRHPLDVFARDHRKLLVTDGSWAMTGGLCIGNEWAGDPARGRRPWRDTMVAVTGPAAAALDDAFASIWRRAGAPLPPDELEADPVECGSSTARVLSGVPGRARMYRAVQLLTASATDRLWITDAYLIAPPPLYASLLDAARAGVDVRLLVPGTSDLPVLRDSTRIGYRDLLRAGARIFEWQGPMLHAKTLLVDHRWARVGSSNLNVSSLLGNYELDLLAECNQLAAALAQQFLRDLATSREIVLQARRRFLPARLVGAPATAPSYVPEQPHKRSRYELGAVAGVTVRRRSAAGGAGGAGQRRGRRRRRPGCHALGAREARSVRRAAPVRPLAAADRRQCRHGSAAAPLGPARRATRRRAHGRRPATRHDGRAAGAEPAAARGARRAARAAPPGRGAVRRRRLLAR